MLSKDKEKVIVEITRRVFERNLAKADSSKDRPPR